MHDGEENCVPGRGLACAVRAIAKDQAKGVGCLMPPSASLHFVWFFVICKLTQAWFFKGIG